MGFASLVDSAMERKGKKPTKITVPQFGGWEQKPQGVPTDYSMVFSQARANKKNQKADLTALQRLANGKPWVIANANHRHGHGHGHSLAHAYARAQTHEDPSVLKRKKTVTCINFCIRLR